MVEATINTHQHPEQVRYTTPSCVHECHAIHFLSSAGVTEDGAAERLEVELLQLML
jgi:hypothetical protein